MQAAHTMLQQIQEKKDDAILQSILITGGIWFHYFTKKENKSESMQLLHTSYSKLRNAKFSLAEVLFQKIEKPI